MFITVKFGDNDSLLCNLICRTRVLYEYIKSNCGCESEDVIDLADENGGQLKNLSEKPQDQYASEYLANRTSFILIKVTHKVDENTGKPIKLFHPMMKGLPDSNPEFIAKLYNRRINPDASSQDQRFPSAKPEKRSRLATRASTLQPSPSRLSKMRSPKGKK